MISHPELEKKQKELESLCNVKYAWLKSSLLKERQAVLLRGRARWLESINGSHWPVQIDLTNDQIMLLRPEWYNGFWIAGSPEMPMHQYWMEYAYDEEWFDLPDIFGTWEELPTCWLQDGTGLTTWYNQLITDISLPKD